MKDLITFNEFIELFPIPEFVSDAYKKYLIDKYSIKIDVDKYKFEYWQCFYNIWQKSNMPDKSYYYNSNNEIFINIDKLETNWKSLTNSEKYCAYIMLSRGYQNWKHNPICKLAFEKLNK